MENLNSLVGKILYDKYESTEATIVVESVTTKQVRIHNTTYDDVILHGNVVLFSQNSDRVSIERQREYIVAFKCIDELKEITNEEHGKKIEEFFKKYLEF